MASPFSATWLLLALLLPMNALGQYPTSATDDLGILQLVTPTVHADQFPITAIIALSTDAYSFYESYTSADTFDLLSAELQVISSAKPAAINSLQEQLFVINEVCIVQGPSDLINDLTAYLSTLASAASPWPFSSAIMSQASGVLQGYKSLVSRDLLDATTSQARVTPGMSIGVSQAAATTGTTGTTGTPATPVGQATSTSKAGGVPAATGNPQLLFGAAAAVAGMLGVIML